MTVLIVFILFIAAVVVLIEIRERKRKSTTAGDNATQSSAARKQPADGCCGEHLVCERETLLNATPDIVYYDDEELDQFANREAESYNSQEEQMFYDVFRTLKETDVAGWCRSLQLRAISLPLSVREEALLIVRELRQSGAK